MHAAVAVGSPISLCRGVRCPLYVDAVRVVPASLPFSMQGTPSRTLERQGRPL